MRNALEQAALMTDDMLLLPAHFGGALGGALGGAEGRAEGGAVDNATGDRPEIRSTAMPVAAASASAAPRPTATDDAGGSKPAATPIGALRSLPEQVAELEVSAILAALQATGGNRVAAARLLKISRAAFYDKLARHPQLADLGR